MTILRHSRKNFLLWLIIMLLLFDVQIARSAPILYVSDDYMNLSTFAYLGDIPSPNSQSASYSGSAWLPEPMNIQSTLWDTSRPYSYSGASAAGWIGPYSVTPTYQIREYIITDNFDVDTWETIAEATIFARLNVTGGDIRAWYSLEAWGDGTTNLLLYDETASSMLVNYSYMNNASGGIVDLLQDHTYSLYGHSYVNGRTEFSGIEFTTVDVPVAHVPEPSTAATFGGGLALLLALGWKRYRRS